MSDVTYADIIRAVNSLLKEEYPQITRYGNDTVDKAVPPYFFVECVPAGINRQTRNMMNKSCSVLITYVQKIPDQVDNLLKAETLCEKLGMVLKIRNRSLRILRYDHEYIGITFSRFRSVLIGGRTPRNSRMKRQWNIYTQR